MLLEWYTRYQVLVLINGLKLLLQYMEKNDITDLTRENFTFSNKVKVGDFYEIEHDESGEQVSHHSFDR